MAVTLTVDGTAGSTSVRSSRVVGGRTPPLLAAGGEITVVFGRSLPTVEVLTRGSGKERSLRWKSAPLRLLFKIGSLAHFSSSFLYRYGRSV